MVRNLFILIHRNSLFKKLILFILYLAIFTGFNQVYALENPLGGNIDSLTDLLQLILEKAVIPVGGIITVFFIIYSGFLFVTARGNKEQLEKAKKAFFWTIIGAIVVLGSSVISSALEGLVNNLSY
jgi:hypothetical protein